MVKVIDNIDELNEGMYVDSWWGQFGQAHLIEQFSADEDMLALAGRHLSQMGPALDSLDELTMDEWETMMDYASELESAINDALPIGLSAEWVDGEFYIMDEATAEELADW